MIALNVNIDHVATLRQARRGIEPEPIHAVGIVKLAGANGITIHLREDRRHILDRDLRLISEIINSNLNLEIAMTNEMLDIALKFRPDCVTFVPEKREEITTEGGLDLIKNRALAKDYISTLKDMGIRTSLFIDPEESQIEEAFKCGTTDIELHTGKYANSIDEKSKFFELSKLKRAAENVNKHGISVNVGHGLNYNNVRQICHLPFIKELNIGHSIISRAIFVGLENAIKEMKKIIDYEIFNTKKQNV